MRISPPQLARAAIQLANRYPVADIAASVGKLLAREGKTALLPRVASALRMLADRTDRVLIETAYPLDSQIQQDFEKLITARYPEARVIFRTTPKILGGFRLQYGATTYDFSNATQLHELQQSLMEVSHGK